MRVKSFVFCAGLLSFLIAVVGAELMHGSGSSGHQNGNAFSAVAASSQPAIDVKGTWSGTFISNNPDISPFTITVKLNSDTRGRLIGDSSVVSQCLDSHHLRVTVNGSNIVLAGSDAAGDTVNFTGTVDNTGTLLTLNYTINGSASRRCEIDNGTGTMGKR